MSFGTRILGVAALSAAFIGIGKNPILPLVDLRARASAVKEVEDPIGLNNFSTMQAYPIVLSDKGRKWIEKNEDVYRRTKKNQDGGLIDASTFLAEDQVQRLDWLSGKKGRFGNTEFEFKKLSKLENGYKYALDITYTSGEKERWYISGQAYYKDQFPDGEPSWISAISIWKGTADYGVDKLTQNYLLYYVLVNNNSIDFQYLMDKVNQAKENRKGEIEDPAGMKNFDLPKNEPIGYIGLADGHDLIFADAVDDVKYFAEMMSSRGYQMVSNEEGKYGIAVEDHPEDIIEREINGLLKKGVRNIYLKLAGHGNKVGVYFNTKEGGSVNLTARELKDIFDKFPECKFFVSTEACSAGGFAAILKEYKDPTGQNGRVTAFLQTKLDATNQEGRLKGVEGVNGAPKIFSTYYNICFAYHMMNGNTYGQAHLLADRDAKALIQCDAEAWKSAPVGGIATTRF